MLTFLCWGKDGSILLVENTESSTYDFVHDVGTVRRCWSPDLREHGGEYGMNSSVRYEGALPLRAL